MKDRNTSCVYRVELNKLNLVLHEQTHVLSTPFFHSSYPRVEYYAYNKWYSHFGKCSLIRMNLVSSAISFWGVVVIIVTQAKIVSYHDRHLKNEFIPLVVVEIFECLHQ
jgi:hypothetical protein